MGSTGWRRCQFYLRTHPDEAKSIHVPCVIFDGRTDDFAAEMFVIINSTATRINRSHLVDLYERVAWAEPQKKFTARVVQMLYEESDSPLQYKINRLGGRSRQDKWILQAELFNEVHKWVAGAWDDLTYREQEPRYAFRFYRVARDFFKAAADVWGEAWGSPKYHVTRPVTLKAMVRVCAALAGEDAEPEEERVGRWTQRLGPWSELVREFREEGFLRAFSGEGPGRARGAHPPIPRGTGGVARAGVNRLSARGGRRRRKWSRRSALARDSNRLQAGSYGSVA